MISAVRRLFRLLRPFAIKLSFATFLSVVTCIGLLIIPAIVKTLLGSAINGTAFSYNLSSWIGIGIGLLIIVVSGYFVFILMYDIAHRVTALLRKQFIERLLYTTMHFYYDSNIGGTIERLLNCIGEIERFITFGLVSTIGIAIILSGGLVMMILLSWKLTLLIFIAIPIVSLGLRYILAHVRESTKERETASRNLFTHIHELLLNIRTVKAFNAQQVELNRFSAKQHDLLLHQDHEARFAALTEPLVTAIAMSVILLILMVGSWQIARHELAIETLIGFLLYVGFLLPQARAISNLVLGLQQVEQAFIRLDEIVQLGLENDTPGATDLSGEQPQSVEIRNITFAYPDRELALDDVSLTIPAQGCVGIVGASGSGKTTLFNLLLRFDAPQHGKILIGGIDIQHVTLTSLRNIISIVPQDIVLFDDTIIENIRYGKPGATDDEVFAACRISQLDEFIQRLPQQYRTIVGERGVKMSGGERQRIAIARALLKDAPILLLDEATSSLDAELEFQLQFALDQAVRGRTTIIIAHRLATVVHLPRIIVFHQGKILDDGTHGELLERCEHYRNLVSKQFISTNRFLFMRRDLHKRKS